MYPYSIYIGLNAIPFQVLWAKYMLYEYMDPLGLTSYV